MCTILTVASVAAAQENAGRSSLPDAKKPASTRPFTGTQGSIPDQSKSLASARAITQIDAKSDAASLAIEDAPAHAETPQEEYLRHLDEVLHGGTCGVQRGTVGDWWRQRLPYVEVVTIEPAHFKASAQHFVIEHTLPPEHEYEVDIFDQRPISVASSQAVTAVRPLSANSDDGQAANDPGGNRLRTDIREIRPTLGYAMRNIDAGELPEGFSEKLDQGDYIARQASPAVLQWAPTNLYHYPLYFEDPALERYGHTYHPVVQPFASAGRFATQLVGIPYQMTLHPVHSREYTLGYYRPGEYAPKKHYQIPFNEEAALMQAAAMAGFFLIFP